MALLIVAGDAGDPLEPYGAIVAHWVRLVTTPPETPAVDQFMARLELRTPCQGGLWANNGLLKKKMNATSNKLSDAIRRLHKEKIASDCLHFISTPFPNHQDRADLSKLSRHLWCTVVNRFRFVHDDVAASSRKPEWHM